MLTRTRYTALPTTLPAAMLALLAAPALGSPTFKFDQDPTSASGGDEGLTQLWEAGFSLSHGRGRSPGSRVTIADPTGQVMDGAGIDWESGVSVDFTLTYDPGQRVDVALRDRHGSVSSVSWETDAHDLTDLRFGGSARNRAGLDVRNLIYHTPDGGQNPLEGLSVVIPGSSGRGTTQTSTWLRADGPLPAFELSGEITLDFSRIRGNDMVRFDIGGFSDLETLSGGGDESRAVPPQIPSPGPIALIGLSGMILLQRGRD